MFTLFNTHLLQVISLIILSPSVAFQPGPRRGVGHLPRPFLLFLRFIFCMRKGQEPDNPKREFSADLLVNLEITVSLFSMSVTQSLLLLLLELTVQLLYKHHRQLWGWARAIDVHTSYCGCSCQCTKLKTTIYITHVTLDPWPSCFSACNIKKLGEHGLGTRLYNVLCPHLHLFHLSYKMLVLRPYNVNLLL